MRIVFTLLACIILFLQCKNEKVKVNYTYVDQNNNRYYISQLSIDYHPIKASESSSGVYDGGEEKKVTISVENYTELVSLAEDILSNKNHENIKREMLTAILYSKDQNENKRSIVLRPSVKRSQFEKLLKEALKK